MIMMQKIMIMVCIVTFHEKCSIPAKNSELSLLLFLYYEFKKMIRFLHQMETGKKSEPQMGFEPTTLRDLAGCSNH